MELKAVTKKNCWTACQSVWKKMIAMGKERAVFPNKGDAVEAAGYEICLHSCPMCEVYCNDERDDYSGTRCKGCPIAHHYNVQYACEYESAYGRFRENGMRNVADAERFAAELKHIRRLDELGLIDYTHPLRPCPEY